METFIAIIRGINVTGHKPLKMDALRKMFEGLHVKNVQTYIQSGNVIFQDHPSHPKELEKKIEAEIGKRFGYDVTVLVLTVKDLLHIISQNPFKGEKTMDASFVHVTILASEPDLSGLEKIDSKVGQGEAYSLVGRAVYLYCPNGYGRSKLKNDILERILKVRATTRNWRTIGELLKMAGAMG